MAGSLNKVMLIGNLGKDPDIRRTQDGRPIASFSLATTESWKDKNSGERRDKTDWHNIVIFNEGLCGVVEKYVKKGSKIFIEGQLQTRKWQDKEGHDRYTTEIVLQNYGGQLIMLDGRSSQGGGDNGYASNQQVGYDNNNSFGMGGGDASKKGASSFSQELDDDIPF